MEKAQGITMNQKVVSGFRLRIWIGFAKMGKCFPYRTLKGFQYRNSIG
jgi:hypothetical protein